MHDLPEVIQQMLRPELYPHPVHSPIRVVQTHISYVVLTGDYAYKVKKPVNMGFLDFSTLEKRRFYCEEELRLNRVFAEALYLEVLPITRAGQSYALGAPSQGSEVIEYTLKMRQFDERDLLTHVFERGDLDEARIREIAVKLSDAHARSETNEDVGQYGMPESIRAMLEENYQHVVPFIGTTQDADQYARTKAFTDAFISTRAERLRARVTGGRIRECHGDLHLNNMCIYQGEVQFFDRIEFNELYKNIDVVYDLAFPVMDLRYRDRPDLANLLANTYFEQTGDYEGAMLLPLYLCMRAYVRGKVYSLLQDDEHLDPVERDAAREEAGAYFAQAAGYAQSRAGGIYCMSGISGSGKSTVGRRLAMETNAIHIRSDAVRKHLAGVTLDASDGELYTEEMNRRTYMELIRLGVLLGSEGFRVVLDAKFDTREQRRGLREAAGEHGLSVWFLQCAISADRAKDRIARRPEDISDATGELIDEQVSNFEAFGSNEQARRIELDTSEPIDIKDLARRVVS